MLKRFTKITMHPAFKRLGGEAFWVAFGIFFSTLGTFVGVRLLTSVLTPAEYGKLALAVSIAMGLVYSLGSGFGGSATRFFSIALRDGEAAWYWRAVRRTLAVIILFSVTGSILAAAAFLKAGAGPEPALVWGLTILFGGIWTVQVLGYSIHAGARNRKTVSWHQCGLEWGRFLAAFSFVLMWRGSAAVVLAGFSVATLFIVFSQWVWIRKLILSTWSRDKSAVDRSADFFNYLWPLLISGLFFWLQMFSDRWALNTFCSLEEVGVYFALYQISYSPMIYFSGFLSGFLGPIFYGQTGDGSDPERRRQTLLMNEKVALLVLGVVFAGVVAAFLIGGPVCAVLIDRNYSAGFWAFPWILASGGIYAVAQQLLLSVYSGMDTRVMIPVRVLSAALSCGFYMTGTFFWGFPGAVFGGLAFSAAFFAITITVHVFRKRRIPLST